MTRHKLMIAALLGSVSLLGAESRERALQEHEGVERTLHFTNPSGKKTIRVDNVFGSIEVIGTAADEVQVTGERTLRADTPAALDKARHEVVIDMTENANTVDLSVNGPFRRADGTLQWNWDTIPYVVRYDLRLRVPAHADLILKTVNEGDVTVRDVSGRMQIQNVNGKITLERVAGSVDANTVNGPVWTSFTQDPSGPCRFRTVNGDVRLGFGPSLSADFAVKTFNGEIRSDYEVVSLPTEAAQGQRENGRYVYHGHRFQRVRVGQGGPEVSMETLNGDIVIANGN